MANQTETLSARQLLILGLLENLTQALGQAPTFSDFVTRYRLKREEIIEIGQLGLLAEEKGLLVRCYTWDATSSLPKSLDGRNRNWALGKRKGA